MCWHMEWVSLLKYRTQLHSSPFSQKHRDRQLYIIHCLGKKNGFKCITMFSRTALGQAEHGQMIVLSAEPVLSAVTEG